jgi:hypothetical protein
VTCARGAGAAQPAARNRAMYIRRHGGRRCATRAGCGNTCTHMGRPGKGAQAWRSASHSYNAVVWEAGSGVLPLYLGALALALSAVLYWWHDWRVPAWCCLL